jgi:quercetin dioxygenase-like cupin family protein
VTDLPKRVCERTERVVELALRTLAAAEVPAFEAHVQQCPECLAELVALQPIIDTMGDWPTDILRPPRPLWYRLTSRIAAEAGTEPSHLPEERWADEPDWKEVAPGISCKLLATDATTSRVSMLVRLAPGIAYPPHTHDGVEELHLLDGELWIEARKLAPGDYNRAEPGTADRRVWSETGCTCVLVTSADDILG